MKTRIISGIFIVLIGLGIIALGGPVMYITGTALSIIALKEFYTAVSGKLSMQNYVSMCFAAIFFALTYIKNTEWVIVFSMLYMLSNFLFLIKEHQHLELKDLFANVFAFIYIVPAFLIMAIIREKNYGAFLLCLVFLSSATTDTFAYFVGKAIGKHKLAPHLSPNKTIEGSIGGSLVSTFVFVVVSLAINKYSNYFEVESLSIVFLVVIGFISSILSQLGDLSASAIKRITGIKDYGHLIPGHGGVLDRMDSALFVAPSLYVVLYLLVY